MTRNSDASETPLTEGKLTSAFNKAVAWFGINSKHPMAAIKLAFQDQREELVTLQTLNAKAREERKDVIGATFGGMGTILGVATIFGLFLAGAYLVTAAEVLAAVALVASGLVAVVGGLSANRHRKEANEISARVETDVSRWQLAAKNAPSPAHEAKSAGPDFSKAAEPDGASRSAPQAIVSLPKSSAPSTTQQGWHGMID